MGIASSYDAVSIASDHACLDCQAIITHAALGVDTRNAIPTEQNSHKMIKA
jgi:hypothetical protein